MNGGWVKSIAFKIAPNPVPLASVVNTAGAVGATFAVHVAVVWAPDPTTTFNDPYWLTKGTTKLIWLGET